VPINSDEIASERRDSKQFQEPEAEDKNDDYLSLVLDKNNKDHNIQTVSNDSNLSNRNNKISARLPVKVEQFT